MSNEELTTLLNERMKEIARDVFQEVAPEYLVPPSEADTEAAKLRGQLALIKAKEHVTIKEAALLLSCSESHIRKLVTLSRKGKSRRPLPFVDVEGVTVFPLRDLLDWASPASLRQESTNGNAQRKEAA